EQARRTPNSVALTTADSEMIYAELAARASRLAQRLRGQGVGPDMPVAICLERSPLLIVALLAVLEAGGAYLPLDPAYPRERLSLMLDDLLLITEEGFAGLFEGLSADTGRRIVLDRLAADEEPSSRHVLPPDLPDSLAYILYTSGSTGQPKGVAVPHRAVVRLVRETGYSSGEVFLHQSPITFDASTLEIWGALLNGGRLVLAPPETPTLAALAALLERQHVTTLWLTASLFHQMVDDQLDGLRPLRRLLAGGDVLSPTHVGRLRAALPGLRLINGYGPTENTTFTCCEVVTGTGGAVPIGRPVANTEVFVVDGEDRAAPIGVAGELVAGGAGLARGYWRRPDLTAERFRPHPFAASPGERLYHTGDRARFLADGRLDFLGRTDRQLKIRGFRIEPAEIEAALAAHPEIREGVVIASAEPGPGGGKRLVAYLVARDGAPSSTTLRFWLRERLPDYMVPQIFVTLAELPVTAHGKIDRAMLPAPESLEEAGVTS